MLLYSFNRTLLYTLLPLRGLVRQQWSLHAHPRLLFLGRVWGVSCAWLRTVKDLSDVMFCFFLPRTRPQLIKDIFFSLFPLFFLDVPVFVFFFLFFFRTISPLHNQRISVEETSLLRKQAFITHKEAQKVLKIRYFQFEMSWAALVLILWFEDREGHVTERPTWKQY